MAIYDIFIVQPPEYDTNLQNWLLSILKGNNVVAEDFPKEGFIGLDLSAELAKELWDKFKQHGARSMVVPSDYRTASRVTLENASELAKQYYENELLPKEPQGLGSITYVNEDVFWYTFRVPSRHLADIGKIPAAYFINIDKIDGHACKDVKEIMQITLDTWFY